MSQHSWTTVVSDAIIHNCQQFLNIWHNVLIFYSFWSIDNNSNAHHKNDKKKSFKWTNNNRPTGKVEFPLNLFICYCSPSSCCPIVERARKRIVKIALLWETRSIKFIYSNVFCCSVAMGNFAVKEAWRERDYGSYRNANDSPSLGRFVYCQTTGEAWKGSPWNDWKKISCKDSNILYCSAENFATTLAVKRVLVEGPAVVSSGKEIYKEKILFLSRWFLSWIFSSHGVWNKVKKKNLYQILNKR